MIKIMSLSPWPSAWQRVAVSWLSESPFVQSLLRSGELDALEFRNLSESMWFRNRVADRRLCFEGGVVEFK
jgi:hypothetical protein